MELRIQHVWPQLGITTTPARQSIEQPRARLEITTSPAQLRMEGEAFRIEINQYPCRAELGMKNLGDMSKEFAELGKTAILEGTASRAQDGDQLAAIEKGGDQVVELAIANALPLPQDFNIAFLPQSRPEINVVGKKQLIIEPGKLNIRATPIAPKIEYTPGKVEISLKDNHQFSFEFVGGNFDKKV